MRRMTLTAVHTLLLISLIANCSVAQNLAFNFAIQEMPSPPTITGVQNFPITPFASFFKVSATIESQIQWIKVCDTVPQSNCASSDWYRIPDPQITPNPPEIKAAFVYYYHEDNISDANRIALSYDDKLDKWSADIPFDSNWEIYDSISYYIVAIDGIGNVASEAPIGEPCKSMGAWNQSEATPRNDSCSYAAGYFECGEFKSIAPGNCGDEYTVGDKQGDVCGEPDANGGQSITNQPRLDIRGISAGVDGSIAGVNSPILCVNMGIGEPPSPATEFPTTLESAEGYMLYIFNPDIPDSNPSDTHIRNAYIITYSPESTGADPTLTRILWDGDCVTNPNNTDPFSCRLLIAVGDHPKLKIGYNETLQFIVKENGFDDYHNIPYSLVGKSSENTVIAGATGMFNLTGGTAFWTSDITSGLRFYPREQTDSVVSYHHGDSPVITETSCSADGGKTGFSVCPRSISQPASNTCRIDFDQSYYSYIVDEYQIYRSTTDNRKDAVKIGSVLEDGSEKYTFEDVITNLNGTKYYYWLAPYNQKYGGANFVSSTSCIIEDWINTGTSCDSDCIHISNCSRYENISNNTDCSSIAEIDTNARGSDGKFALTPVSGLYVFVADSSNTPIDIPAITDSNGNFHIVIDNNSGLIDLEKTYKVVLKIPAASKGSTPCDTSFFDVQGNCYIVLAEGVSLTDDDSVTTRVFGVKLPAANGGRAEIGNPNCDNVVDIADLSLLRPGFGTVQGEDGYQTYLDFDGNGIIDIADFAVFRIYFGYELSTAPDSSNPLCKP